MQNIHPVFAAALRGHIPQPLQLTESERVAADLAYLQHRDTSEAHRALRLQNQTFNPWEPRK